MVQLFVNCKEIWPPHQTSGFIIESQSNQRSETVVHLFFQTTGKLIILSVAALFTGFI